MNQHRELARASLFYLASMLLVVSLGAFLQSRSFALGLIGTELFCILLPALIYLRWSRRSLSAALPLRWPGWKIALACLLLGAAVFQIDALVEGIAVQISGYSQFLSPQAIPSTWPQALLTFVALVIAAPVCEEILFRGVILPAGLPYGKNFALAFSSILFIFFHLRLQGLPALVLVAFMLGWVALRTRSLTAAILVHMINNAFGAVLMILNGLYPQVKLPFPTLTTILISPLLLAGAVIALRRWTQSSEPSNAEMIAQPRGAAWLRTYWPLLIALLVYLTMAGYELVLGKRRSCWPPENSIARKVRWLPENFGINCGTAPRKWLAQPSATRAAAWPRTSHARGRCSHTMRSSAAAAGSAARLSARFHRNGPLASHKSGASPGNIAPIRAR